MSPVERAKLRAGALGFRGVRSCVASRLGVKAEDNEARRVADSIYRNLRSRASMERASEVLGVPMSYWTETDETAIRRMAREGQE